MAALVHFVKRGHLENKVDVYDQRNDCKLNLDPEMTIVAHDILVHIIWLKYILIFEYLKINTIGLKGFAWNFLKNTSLI